MLSIFGSETPTLQINYAAHTGQQEIVKAIRANFKSPTPAAIVEIICSRGWGKTLFVGCELLAFYLETNPGVKVMWVAPTYGIGMTLVDDVFRGTDERTGEQYIPEFDGQGRRVWEFCTTKSGPIIRWHNGATVFIRSADSPDSIVSKGFNRIIIDEAALVDERVFNQQILGTARKQGIKIFIITTPRGTSHWTYKFYLKGQTAADTQYLSFQQDYTKNPYFNPTLKELMKDIPEWMFRQEYLAEFVKDGETVVRGLDEILFGPEIDFETDQQEWSLPLADTELPGSKIIRRAEDRRFAVGLDIAKSKDYSVLWTMDLETGQLVYYRRLNRMDYRDLLTLTAEVCHKWNQAELIFDATGVGQGLGDMLNNYDITAHPFVFTNESKTEIVNKLLLSIEYREIAIPNITTAKKELRAFTYTMTRTGKISYGAPSGIHDDIVMSLAMVNWFRKENSVDDTVGVIDEIAEWNSFDGDRPKSFLDQMADDND